MALECHKTNEKIHKNYCSVSTLPLMEVTGKDGKYIIMIKIFFFTKNLIIEESSGVIPQLDNFLFFMVERSPVRHSTP